MQKKAPISTFFVYNSPGGKLTRQNICSLVKFFGTFVKKRCPSFYGPHDSTFNALKCM